MNNIDILEEKEKRLRAYLAVLNEENILYKKEDAIEGIIKLFETLIAENKELKEEHDLFMEGELYTAKQLKNIEKDRNKYYIHKLKVSEIVYSLYNELLKRDMGESYIYNYKNERISLDTGYAFDGIDFFIEELKNKF